jgi:hypothetical protein
MASTRSANGKCSNTGSPGWRTPIAFMGFKTEVRERIGRASVGVGQGRST